jgi:methionine-rich copper-binding protein CopC
MTPLFAKVALVPLALALLLASGVARAQALTLASSSPSEAQVVTPPAKITLTFSGPVDPKGMTAWITDAAGTPGANALCPQVTGHVSGATATLAVPLNVLHPGLVVAVLWTAHAKGASDAQSGKLTFTVGAAPALVGSSPSAAASVGSPPESISLSFDEPVADSGTTVTVTVESGGAPHAVTALAPSVSADGKTVTVTLTNPPAGAYRVTWAVKSRVGIPTHGMVRFTAQ